MEFSLQELGLVDAPSEARFDKFTKLASTLIDAPVSLVSIVDFDGDRQVFKSQLGLAEPWASERQTPLSHSFCQHVVRRNAPLVVANAPEHTLVKDNLAIPDLGVIAYLGVPVKLASGQPLGALCVISGQPRDWSEGDIATLQTLSEGASDLIQLRAALLSSEKLRQEQRDFTYALTHDLRSPTNTVEMILKEVAQHGPNLDDDLREIVDKGLETLGRMHRQIEDVLTYAHTVGGSSDFAPVALNGLLQDVLNDMKSEILATGARVSIPELPVLTCDAPQIRGLFQNLIANALKFQPKGQAPQVDIRWKRDPNTGLHVIEVADNGIGIPQRDQMKIFKIFSRLQARDVYKGSGIGLAVCARVAQNHHGTIHVHSDGKTGSTFILRLPELGHDD